MKKTCALFVLLSAWAVQSHAGPRADFACEKIKEKSVRISCIESRNEKEQGRKKETGLTEEMRRFVADAKGVIVKGLKDPGSAQFSGLFVSIHKGTERRFLCGQINAKNSYGGYVGKNNFYVQDKLPDFEMYGWISSDMPSSYSPELAIQTLKVAAIYCQGETIIQVE